jgi:hypothetical protein
MKFGTVTTDHLNLVPRIPSKDVRILWVNDFYDGPIEGIAEVNSTRCRYEMVDRDVLGTNEESRTYWLIALTPKQVADEEFWHDLFCEKVGTHFDCTGRSPPPREQIDPDGFYQPYRLRKAPDYSENDVLGWFKLND